VNLKNVHVHVHVCYNNDSVGDGAGWVVEGAVPLSRGSDGQEGPLNNLSTREDRPTEQW